MDRSNKPGSVGGRMVGNVFLQSQGGKIQIFQASDSSCLSGIVFFLMATMAPARSWCRPSFTKKCHFGWAMQQDLLMASRSNAESANVRMVERGTSSLMGVSLQMQLLTGCFDYLNTVPIYLLLQQIPTQNPICRKLTGCKLGDPEKKEVLVRIHISVTMIPSWTAVSGYFNLGNPMENHHF